MTKKRVLLGLAVLFFSLNSNNYLFAKNKDEKTFQKNLSKQSNNLKRNATYTAKDVKNQTKAAKVVKNVEEKVVSIPKDATQKEKKNTLKTKVSEKIKNLKNPNYPIKKMTFW